MYVKAPIIGLAMATVAFAGSSLYFWQQLENERGRAAQVAETTRQLNARIVQLEKARTDFGQQRLASTGGHLTAGPAGVPPPPGIGMAPQAGADRKQVWTVTRAAPSPGMQKMMRTQARARNKRLYAPA